MELTGQKFGKLTVLKKDDRSLARKGTSGLWLCRCDCGNTKVAYGSTLKNGKLKSCGRCSRVKDLRGQRYGRLVVIAPADPLIANGRKYSRWLCQCDCGNTTVVIGSNLRAGTVNSCGCLAEEAHKKQSRKTTKYCIICGKPFTRITSLAKHKVTCSPACKALRIKAMSTGRQFNEETRAKMSDSHKTEKAYEHLDEIRSASTEALLKDPRLGRFESNIHAIWWHLVSPEGEEYKFKNLSHWLRTTGYIYFGVDAEDHDIRLVRIGLQQAKKKTKKTGRQFYYKGWAVIPTQTEL